MTFAPPADRTSAPPLHAALRRGGLLGMAGFSAAANVLLLVAPVYMLQLCGRVPPSASHATLLALTGVAAFLSSCFGLLDWVQQRLMRTPLGEVDYRFEMPRHPLMCRGDACVAPTIVGRGRKCRRKDLGSTGRDREERETFRAEAP